jgi:hypothetical protein
MQISIFWDYWGNHELDLAIRPFKKIDPFERSFGISGLMLIYDRRKYGKTLAPFPHSCDELEIAVKELADQLRKYGTKMLQGDLSDLEKIQKLEKKAAKRYSR